MGDASNDFNIFSRSDWICCFNTPILNRRFVSLFEIVGKLHLNKHRNFDSDIIRYDNGVCK